MTSEVIFLDKDQCYAADGVLSGAVVWLVPVNANQNICLIWGLGRFGTPFLALFGGRIPFLLQIRVYRSWNDFVLCPSVN